MIRRSRSTESPDMVGFRLRGQEVTRLESTRFHRSDPDHARCDPEKDFRLANRLLGSVRNEWMELRHDACCNESRYRYHWRRKPLSDEVVRVDRNAPLCRHKIVP